MFCSFFAFGLFIFPEKLILKLSSTSSFCPKSGSDISKSIFPLSSYGVFCFLSKYCFSPSPMNPSSCCTICAVYLKNSSLLLLNKSVKKYRQPNVIINASIIIKIIIVAFKPLLVFCLFSLFFFCFIVTSNINFILPSCDIY